MPIEGISGFKDFVAEVKRLTNCPVKEISKVKDKLTRLELQSVKFENGHVYINTEINEGLKLKLIDQLINNHPDHDDIRDAVVLALEQDIKGFQIAVV